MAGDVFSAKLDVRGVKELISKLTLLSKNIAKKGMRQALRAGGKPILKKAKELVPVRTGVVKKALRLRAGRRSRKWISYVVTLDKSAKAFTGKAWYGSFLEFGAPARGLKPQRPITRAYEATKAESLEIIKRTLKDYIASQKPLSSNGGESVTNNST